MLTSDNKVGGWVKKGQNYDDVPKPEFSNFLSLKRRFKDLVAFRIQFRPAQYIQADLYHRIFLYNTFDDSIINRKIGA